MIMDYIFVVSDDQAVTVTAPSTDYVDLGAADQDLNVGSPIYAHVFLTTPFDTSANTLTIDVGNDANTPPTTKHQEILPATATSALLAAAHLCEATIGNVGGDLDGRYLNMLYTCSAGLTSGVLFSYFGNH